jgi:uncharacterized protein (DUF1697 family)
MPTYVAFLRAINVGGRFVKMAALAQHFRDLGYGDAHTYINSGNVVFRSTSRNAGALAAAIDQGLPPRLGFETHAFVRSIAQVHAVAGHGMALASDSALADVNVAFLGAALSEEQVSTLATLRSAADDFMVHGTEVYWKCRIRQSQSKFSNALFERKLKVRTTLRRAVMLQGLSEQLRSDTTR